MVERGRDAGDTATSPGPKRQGASSRSRRSRCRTRRTPRGRGVTTASAAATSTGCTSTSPGSTTLSLKVNGFTRTVIVHVPKRSTGTTPLALVFNMHGSGSTALAQEDFTKMNFAANQDRFHRRLPSGADPRRSRFRLEHPRRAVHRRTRRCRRSRPTT